jgi:hypothetical protein
VLVRVRRDVDALSKWTAEANVLTVDRETLTCRECFQGQGHVGTWATAKRVVGHETFLTVGVKHAKLDGL